MLSTESLVIFAYGNPSRGDDALGPLLLHRLTQMHDLQENIEFIEDFQLQIEHALDLEKRQLALFIDASITGASPFTFTRLTPKRDETFTTHALHPAAVLYTYQQIKNQSPPASFLLSVRGEQFELGESLSITAQHNLEATTLFLKQLCQSITITYWQSCITE